jgi:hypothetical protein
MSLQDVQHVFRDRGTRAKAVRWTAPAFVIGALIGFNLWRSGTSWPLVAAWSLAGTAALVAFRANLVAKWILNPSTRRITPTHVALCGLIIASWFLLCFVVLR